MISHLIGRQTFYHVYIIVTKKKEGMSSQQKNHMKHAVILIFITSYIINNVSALMLKNLTCGLYDAEFSKFEYNKRLEQDIVTSLAPLGMRQCLTRCTTHPICRSVNYNRLQQICELLGVTLNWVRGTGGGFKHNLIKASGWNHVDTRDKMTVKTIF